MNDLLRDARADQRHGRALLDGEAGAPETPARRSASSRLLRSPRLGALATNLGRTTPLASPPGEGVSGPQRRVLPLVELRADFVLSERSCATPTVAPRHRLRGARHAAHRIAVAENIAVFHGWPDAIAGIAEASPYDPLQLGDPTATPAGGQRGGAAPGSGIAARTGWRWTPAYQTVLGPPSTAATRCRTI